MATTIYQGDTHTVALTVTENGVAVGSLAGAAYELKIATDPNGTALVTKSTGDFSAVANVASCELTAADTELLTPGVYWLEVEITDSTGRVRRVGDELIVAASLTS